MQGGSHASEAIPQDVQEVVSKLHLRLEPMHSGVADSTLSRYYYVDVADTTAADNLVEQLRQSPSVEAAFLKPPEGPP